MSPNTSLFNLLQLQFLLSREVRGSQDNNDKKGQEIVFVIALQNIETLLGLFIKIEDIKVKSYL